MRASCAPRNVNIRIGGALLCSCKRGLSVAIASSILYHFVIYIYIYISELGDR